MFYPYIPIGLFFVFLVYVLYLILIKKNFRAKFRSEIIPGILFFVLWGCIYYFLMK